MARLPLEEQQSHESNHFRGWEMAIAMELRSLRAIVFSFVVCVLLSGCLSTKSFVDPALPTVVGTDFAAPTDRRSTNVLFEFRTKGAANARGTAETKLVAIEAVRQSGLFSDVIDGAARPAESQLTIVIDNVPITDNAAAKGFGTGLTLGLAGSLVTDGYICTVNYASGGSNPVETTTRHALHTTIGNHRGPEGLTPVQMQDGVRTVISQLVLNALKQLNDQRAFAGE